MIFTEGFIDAYKILLKKTEHLQKIIWEVLKGISNILH